jgi:ABC-type multidrug transport system ATPase subunit
MKINLQAVGKRYNREWIFRGITLTLSSSVSYSITGPNGSGKSTLLQTIGGMLQPSEGQVLYQIHEKEIAAEDVYKHLSLCAPYLDVIEEMTLVEFLSFHQKFKPFITGIDVRKIIEVLGLQAAAHKQIRYYSSGMKQRVKLAQAFFSNTPLLLLDEPCSNLDGKGIELYHSLIEQYCENRLVFVCSNDPVEYSFCKEEISMTAFKITSPQLIG